MYDYRVKNNAIELNFGMNVTEHQFSNMYFILLKILKIENVGFLRHFALKKTIFLKFRGPKLKNFKNQRHQDFKSWQGAYFDVFHLYFA